MRSDWDGEKLRTVREKLETVSTSPSRKPSNHAGLQRFKLEAVSENCEPFVKIEVVTVPESPRHGADWLTGHRDQKTPDCLERESEACLTPHPREGPCLRGLTAIST